MQNLLVSYWSQRCIKLFCGVPCCPCPESLHFQQYFYILISFNKCPFNSVTVHVVLTIASNKTKAIYESSLGQYTGYYTQRYELSRYGHRVTGIFLEARTKVFVLLLFSANFSSLTFHCFLSQVQTERGVGVVGVCLIHPFKNNTNILFLFLCI